MPQKTLEKAQFDTHMRKEYGDMMSLNARFKALFLIEDRIMRGIALRALSSGAQVLHNYVHHYIS